MALYSVVESRFWQDEKVRQWPDDVKLLALYLLTCPHKNLVGCFVLPKQYICADLGWSEKKLEAAFKHLLRERFIWYDTKTNLILIANYLKYNPIPNPNCAKAAAAKIAELPRSPLLSILKCLLEPFARLFGDLEAVFSNILPDNNGSETVTPTVSQPLGQPFANGSETVDETVSKPIPEPDPDSDPDPSVHSIAAEIDSLASTDGRTCGFAHSDKKPQKASPEAKKAAAYLKERLEAREIYLPRDWHLKAYAVAQRILKKVDYDTLIACIDWALSHPYWSSHIDGMSAIERALPKFQAKARSPTVNLPTAEELVVGKGVPP